MPPRPSTTCIYCKQLRPPSREHVLARSLGGDATSWIVCAPCNNGALSRLDAALAERSAVALSRAAATPPSAFNVEIVGDHFQYDAAQNLHVEVKIVNELRSLVHPQIHVHLASGAVSILAAAHDQRAALTALIEDRLGRGTLRGTHVKIGPFDVCTTARFVMHQEDGAFVRVAVVGDASKLFDALEGHWPQIRSALVAGDAAEQSIARPQVSMRMRIRVDDVYRAVAKTAFNTLAMRVGVAFALRAEFDPLRAYILGTDVRHPPDRAPNEVAVDRRFVQSLPFDAKPILPTTDHAVTITHFDGVLVAFVTLYAKHSYIVTLGSIELPDATFLAHEFSTVRQGNDALELKAVFERLTTSRQG